MNNHLSEEQFAKCFVGVATNEERQHLTECAKCLAEVEGFGSTVSSLRMAIRDRVEDRTTRIQPTRDRMPRVRRAIATAAVILLGLVPLLTSQRPQRIITEASSETNPDALMNAINLHLSRAVPSPMEPMMSLLPSDEYITDSGGIK
jgi:hypothetical protein